MTSADQLWTYKLKRWFIILMKCHNVVLCKHITLLPYTQVRVTVVTILSGFIHMEPKNSVWTESHVCVANGIHEVVSNKPLKI